MLAAGVLAALESLFFSEGELLEDESEVDDVDPDPDVDPDDDPDDELDDESLARLSVR